MLLFLCYETDNGSFLSTLYSLFLHSFNAVSYFFLKQVHYYLVSDEQPRISKCSWYKTAQLSQLTKSRASKVDCGTQMANYYLYVNLNCWVVAPFHAKPSLVNCLEIRTIQLRKIMSIIGQSVIPNIGRVNGLVLWSYLLKWRMDSKSWTEHA